MDPLVVAGAFVLTNLDTLVVLVAFCADEDYRPWEILLGHLLGFGIGLAFAVGVVLVAAEFLQEWAFLIGVVPLALGAWGLFRQRPARQATAPLSATGRFGRLGVVTMTGIGLSGENLVVYIPLFSTFSRDELAVTVVAFLLGAGVLYLLSVFLARRIRVVGPPRWLDRWLVPATLTVVGLYVLLAGWIAA